MWGAGTVAIALGVATFCAVLIAALTGDQPRHRAALAISLVALASPLLVTPELPFPRFLVLMVGVCIFGRTLDLALRGSDFGFGGRVWMLVTIFDAREAVVETPRVDWRELAWLALHVGLLAGGLAVAWKLAPGFSGPGYWTVRWLGALLVSYGLSESLQSLMLVGYRLGGIRFSRINDYPVISLTLAEFWGRRWNRTVSKWLHSFAFMPVSRRLGTAWGTSMAFAASTALHVWTAGVPVGWVGGLWMGSFFVVQGALVLLERRIGVARWPGAAQRSWTLGWLVITSPLFCEPMLQILDSLR